MACRCGAAPVTVTSETGRISLKEGSQIGGRQRCIIVVGRTHYPDRLGSNPLGVPSIRYKGHVSCWFPCGLTNENATAGGVDSDILSLAAKIIW